MTSHPRFAGPDEPDDTSPTQPMERPAIHDNVALTSEIKVRCAMRVEHMAQKRRMK